MIVQGPPNRIPKNRPIILLDGKPMKFIEGNIEGQCDNIPESLWALPDYYILHGRVSGENKLITVERDECIWSVRPSGRELIELQNGRN